MSINAGILGATGYTGYQLVSLLLNHGSVKIKWLTSEKFKDRQYSYSFPALRDLVNTSCSSITRLGELGNVDVVFSCLPEGTSIHFIKKLYKTDAKIIDLSPDLRLKNPERFEEFFDSGHTAPELASESVYGLPELNREDIIGSRLVSNPGCFATCVILSIAPLIKNKIKISEVVADIKAPISGAGRAPRLEYHYPEVNQNIYSESFERHFQEVEVEEFLETRFEVNQKIVFRTHRIPVKRGILSTIYLKLKKKTSFDEIFTIYEGYYKDEDFIRIRERGNGLQLKNVLNSNYCDINFDVIDNHLIIETVLDNIMKGASGQAVQNMNIMFGFKEDTGLGIVPSYP